MDRGADLQPPLGVNGGPCKVVERINQRVRDPDDRRDLIRQLLRGQGLDNKDAMVIYSLEPEKLKGMPFVLGPHLQYRMDHRGITLDQVRKGLLNYYEAAKAGTAPKVTRDTKTTWLDPSGLEMSIGVSAARGVLMVITAYWKGKPDPKVPAEGCGNMPKNVGDSRTAGSLPEKSSKPVLTALVRKLNAFIAEHNLDVSPKPIVLSNSIYSQPGSGRKIDGYMFGFTYMGSDGYQYYAHINSRNVLTADNKLIPDNWSFHYGASLFFNDSTPKGLYKTLTEALLKYARVAPEKGAIVFSDIERAIASAVKSLKGEGFSVYDTTPKSMSFGFRTWDIPKESEDQDDDVVDAVIAKFRKRILSNIGNDFVELYLSLGDKNYLEGEVSVKSPSPTRVASMFLEAGNTNLSRLSPAIRKSVARDLQQKGLDGNGRFTSFGSILNTMDSVLKANGLVMEDSWDLNPRGQDGKFRFPLKWEDGREVSSSMAVLTWHKFVETTGNYEAVVYLS